MPSTQTRLQFPVRKSARRKIIGDKENFVPGNADRSIASMRKDSTCDLRDLESSTTNLFSVKATVRSSPRKLVCNPAKISSSTSTPSRHKSSSFASLSKRLPTSPPASPSKKQQSPPTSPSKRQRSPPPASPSKRQRSPPASPSKRQRSPPPASPARRQRSPPPASPARRQRSPPPASPARRQRSPPPASPARRQQSPPPASPARRQRSPPPASPSRRQRSPPPASPSRRQRSPPPVSPSRRQRSPPPVSPARRQRSPPPASPARRQQSPPPGISLRRQLISLPTTPSRSQQTPIISTPSRRQHLSSQCSPHKFEQPRTALRSSPRKLVTPKKSSGPSADVTTPSLSKEELYAQVKSALNTQQPTEVVCREKEIEYINTFLDKHINKDRCKSGSLYISGAPGTGKTAVVKHVLQCRSKDIAQSVFINAMTVKTAFSMFKNIAIELGTKGAASVKSAQRASEMVKKHLTSSGKTVLLVLDEMDQLNSKHQEVLYTMFEWPSLPNSRLILIGIANALDLTDRILPRLNSRVECRPELLHFKPYTRDQIVTVIDSRLQKTPEVYSKVLDKSAMMFCARKVSAVAGDMRKALDICRRSLEFTQLASRKENLLKAKGDSVSNAATTITTTTPGLSTVGITQVARVVDEVYGSTSTATKPSTFPLQQKLVICTLLLLLKSSKLKELTLGKVHDTYCRVCKKREVTPTDQSEFISLCQLLETRGLVSLKKGKETRLTKISLKLDPKELEFALKDKLLISSVLESTL